MLRKYYCIAVASCMYVLTVYSLNNLADVFFLVNCWYCFTAYDYRVLQNSEAATFEGSYLLLTSLKCLNRVPTGPEKPRNFGRPFSGPIKSLNGKQQRLCIVVENDGNVMEFLTTEAEAEGAQEQLMKSCWTNCCEIFVNLCKYISVFILTIAR